MSISVPLAVTMMMGTRERVRIDRQTSTPDILGSIRSKRRMSGSVSSYRRSASAPSRATMTRNPSLVSPMTSASMKDSSSSARSTRTGPSPEPLPGVGFFALLIRHARYGAGGSG